MVAKNNIIILNRGDTCQFDLLIADNTSPDGLYRLQEDDTVYFGLMEPHQPFEEALVKKRFTVADANPYTGILTIVITPEDTLDLLPGTYYYSVKIHLQHNGNRCNCATDEPLAVSYIDHVDTVINRAKFFLCE